eukprot:GHVR01190771.1.p1 GENE.GHVR01190771.1~~GHVR01190771.1.p1  ORF type:complete len:129 (+),score=18.99 GHVR01190771.1:381-767(+)
MELQPDGKYTGTVQQVIMVNATPPKKAHDNPQRLVVDIIKKLLHAESNVKLYGSAYIDLTKGQAVAAKQQSVILAMDTLNSSELNTFHSSLLYYLFIFLSLIMEVTVSVTPQPGGTPFPISKPPMTTK